MAKSHRPSAPTRQPGSRGAPAAQAALTLEQARSRTEKSPDDAKAWYHLGALLSKARELEGARHAAEKVVELTPEDPQGWVLLGQVETQYSNDPVAIKHFEHALSLDESLAGAHHGLADIYWRMNRGHDGLRHIDRTLELNPGSLPAIWTKAQLLANAFRFEEAIELHEYLVKHDEKARYSHLTNLASTKRDLGLLNESEEIYRRAIKLSPPKNSSAFSNWLTLLHYMPEKSAEEILEACKQWASFYPPQKDAKRPVPADLSPSRKLRIGLFSDGFRQHPVGAMTTTALEHLGRHGIELYLYTTSSTVDHVTKRLQAVAQRWTPITQVGDEALAEMFRDDEIDILIDLAGYNAGTRMPTMTMEPAPILMKWVGGLINTTGLETIDYLITDSVESPPGSDHLYTEKLIRMPDDYICYMPPPKLPEETPLPALQKGHVTFGCFNNPTKINDVTLGHWAELMQAVPGSHLFLKGAGYGTESMRKRIRDFLAGYGIEPERVRMEGQSPHYKLFEAYNDVDVALDPWPYSGGLTTCEALLMGVPVVTLPGPTFAGRHSATHLANVGMPELVVSNWDEYRARVLGLVSDLSSLATIRRHLRQVLLESPVCDAPRFAGHLATAFRAIWQRYCAGKKPAALAFTSEGKPWFEDEDAPMEVVAPDATALPAEPPEDESFNFAFQGKLIVLDHGGSMYNTPVIQIPNRTKALSVVVIDPASRLRDVPRLKYEKVLHDYHAHVALGDGEPGVLYTCLHSDLSGTLEPLAPSRQQPFIRQPASLLAKLPIGTVRLDRIDGLDSLDWLILNESHDSKKILQGAEGLMASLLLVHVRVLFVDVYKKQPDLGSITKLLGKYGFRVLRMENQRMGNLFSDPRLRQQHSSVNSQLLSYDALFVPDDQRIKELTDQQRIRLAFILHTAYRSPDMAHRVLEASGEHIAQSYLATQLPKPKAPAKPAAAQLAADAATDTGTEADSGGAPAVLKGKDVKHRLCLGVPVYNEDKYLEQTIQSLKKQDADAVKFLISDNASTDRSAEILRDLTAGDERFELVHQPDNIGALKNWKFLFEQSSSEYFMWLGGHDYLSDGYLAKMLDAIGAAPGTAMVCGMPHSVMDGRTGPVQAAVYDFSDDSPVVRYMNSVAKLANCTILHSVFRRAALEGFEITGTISWDHVLISRLLWTGKLQYVPDATYYRRYFGQRDTSTEQRMTGQKKTALPRADFYDYYVKDFAKLAQSTLPAAEFDKLRKEILRILKARFGN
ncbi:Poly-beta-1,6-N-acetyl-D-glucosamine synthase [Bordetella sputigena]|uniref:O-linked N-acetylglucosamine transferase family protein n=1 Tax=Bordetella sputigena TaxID=1416810 RepID=UPI0039EEB5CE